VAGAPRGWATYPAACPLGRYGRRPVLAPPALTLPPLGALVRALFPAPVDVLGEPPAELARLKGAVVPKLRRALAQPLLKDVQPAVHGCDPQACVAALMWPCCLPEDVQLHFHELQFPQQV
jgi:hypothetical protein